MLKSSQREQFWYALYTRPRFEKKVDFILKQKGLKSFLPLRNVIRYWSNGKKNILEPIFPSYVFVYANSQERHLALQSYGVARFVSFNGKPAHIPEEQIHDIHQILEFGCAPERVPYLVFGDKVEIVSGPLRGVEGFYVEDRGMHRLVISVDIIRQAIAITVDRDQIRRKPAMNDSSPGKNHKNGKT